MKTYSSSPLPREKLELADCPICGSSEFQPRWDLGSFRFVTCLDCGHVYQNPRPSPEDLELRYDEDYLDYEIENMKNFFHLMRKGLEDAGFSSFEAELKAELGDARLPRALDIGCATGVLLVYLQGRGWDCTGIDVCEPAVEYGRTYLGVDIRLGSLEDQDFEEASFDLIHSSHVIEHIPDPEAFLQGVQRLLRPGGIFILTTPRTGSFQEKFWASKWRSVIADHVHLFSRENLQRLLVQSGFTLEHWVSWGGIPQGKAPRIVKRLVDRAAKAFGFGDVMLVRARKT